MKLKIVAGLCSVLYLSSCASFMRGYVTSSEGDKVKVAYGSKHLKVGQKVQFVKQECINRRCDEVVTGDGVVDRIIDEDYSIISVNGGSGKLASGSRVKLE